MRILTTAVVVVLLCGRTCAGAAREPVAVILVAGSVSIEDVAEPGLVSLAEMFESGSAGLMNVRTGRPSRHAETTAGSGMEAGCVSIGAGAMAVGGAEVRRACDAGGSVNGVGAREIYKCRTLDGPGDAAVLHTEIIKIRNINASASYAASPGALGSALRNAGIATAAIGSADLPGEMHREAVAVAMDESGIVDFGAVGSVRFTETDVKAPYGVRTNGAELLRELDAVLAKARFIVIDFGDTSRADSYAQSCTEARAAAIRRDALKRLDEFVGLVEKRLDFDTDLLVVLSPTPPVVADRRPERLTLTLIRGPGFERGMLTSDSTRTSGITTISDVAPTILEFFEVKSPRNMVGRPIRRTAGHDVPATLLRMHASASLQSDQQSGMRGGSVVQSIVVVLVTLAVVLGAVGAWRKAAQWAALIVVALPLGMLYLPTFYAGGLAGAVGWLVVLTAAMLAVCAWGLRSAARACVWLCGAVVVSLVVDIARGAPLMSSSMAGYSFMEGARYYGIGNELVGTMLGATLIGVGMALSGSGMAEKLRAVIAVVVFGAVFAAIGAPGLGANTGGAMAAFPAVAVVLLNRRGWRPTGRGIAVVAALMVLVVLGLSAFDAIRGGGSASHMGRVAGLAAGGDTVGVMTIMQRKVALNFMLLSTSLWSRLLVLSLVCSLGLFYWGRRRFGVKLLTREESAAAVGCCVGVVGACAFNDSGVVAAAGCSVFLWALLALRTMSRSGDTQTAGELSVQLSGCDSQV